MSANSSYEESIEASTPGSVTPSASDIMSIAPTDELQNTSSTNDNTFHSFQDAFAIFKTAMTRLEVENKRLVEHNTAIEKELVTLREDNVKLTEANDDAIRKLAKVEEEKARFQKVLTGFEGLGEVLGWKNTSENQERIEKMLENYIQKIEKRIVEVEEKGQQNLEQAIDRIKADHAREIQGPVSTMESINIEDWTDGYIFRKTPLKPIPNGVIQVSRAEVKLDHCNNSTIDGSLSEKDIGFLYAVRDQFKNFRRFTEIAELAFGLDECHLGYLKGSKSRFLCLDKVYGISDTELMEKWQEEASQKDRIYILSGNDSLVGDLSDTVYYIEDLF
ncbi:hypothetical protein BZA77DRAFT_359573 [Pyronema omphalodes]|nr:hypothetical protein BZA77DRAFT_359573 [Pyronema omphalodes]